MTLRTASKERTPCEIIRKINDIAQGDSISDNKIRELCFEAEIKTKQLAKELNKYKKEAWAGWYEDNESFKEDFKRRINNGYRIKE